MSLQRDRSHGLPWWIGDNDYPASARVAAGDLP